MRRGARGRRGCTSLSSSMQRRGRARRPRRRRPAPARARRASWRTSASSAVSRMRAVRSAITGEAARHRHRVLVGKLHGALADVGGEVADALELAVDLDDGDDEAQVAGHRLVQREELEALLLDLDLVLVDRRRRRRSPGAPWSASRVSIAWKARRRFSSTSAPRARILRLSRSISRCRWVIMRPPALSRSGR